MWKHICWIKLTVFSKHNLLWYFGNYFFFRATKNVGNFLSNKMTFKTLFKNLICQIGSSQRKRYSKVIQIKEMNQPIPLFNSVLNVLSFLEKPEVFLTI